MSGAAAGRALGAARVAWGTALLLAPKRLVKAAGGQPDPAAVRVARLLAGRHLAQGALELAAWPRWRRAGEAVDLLHSASLLPVAALDRRQRRALLVDSALAFGWACAGHLA